jgi:LmbE family N-acetylglucosaminyl deacetylase
LESFYLSPAALDNADVPRALLIAAHPDDETIGAGVLLARRPNFRIVHVTDGSPLNPSDALAAGCPSRAAYGTARRREAIDAMAAAGIPADAITNLHFTDQQAAFHLEELTRRILAVIDQIKPEVVLTHAYEGGHPDHDSVALACHLARCSTPPGGAFFLCEFTGYHARQGTMEIYEFLGNSSQREFAYSLDQEEREIKIRMLEKFTTQIRTLQPFVCPEMEKFRLAPQYDFTRPPHAGRLWYENFNWGVDGATWREMASQTLNKILHP